jgi:hypothetical protein
MSEERNAVLRNARLIKWLDETSECSANITTLAALVEQYDGASEDVCVDTSVVGGAGRLMRREAEQLTGQIRALRAILVKEGIR